MSKTENKEPSFISVPIALLTISDSRTLANDDAGDLLAQRIESAGHQLAGRSICKDNIYKIRALVSQWLIEDNIQAIITTGGTGITGYDGTPEAILPLLDKVIDGFGGISVGGISPNRKMFGALLPGVDHLKHTHNLEHNAFSRGQPKWGAHLADELEEIFLLHDPSTVAAVIMEPIAGSGGVLIPPEGYLDRIRKICDDNGVLLIFDEVITGFGRTGESFAAEAFKVKPDLITIAKGMTSGMVPMGGVLVKEDIYETFMTGPEDNIELYHGYTYSGHPLAAAAGLATLRVYEEEGLFARAKSLAPILEEELQTIKGCPYVIDIRNYGLLGGVELEPIEGSPTARAMSVFRQCFDNGLLVRTTGDTIALCPPLIASEDEIRTVVAMLKTSLSSIA